MYSFVASGDHGKGVFLGGTLGSSVKGTHTISDNYEAVGFTTQGKDGSSKYFLLEYLRDYSQLHPQEIVSIKDFPEFPVVLQAMTKNAVLYGIKFNKGKGSDEASLDLTAPSNYEGETCGAIYRQLHLLLILPKTSVTLSGYPIRKCLLTRLWDLLL